MKCFLRSLAWSGLILGLANYAIAQDVAIVVGVSDYKAFKDTDNGDLRFADEDARLFSKTAIAWMGFKKENVIVLTSHPVGDERQATAANILAAFNDLNQKMLAPTKSKL